MKSKIFYYINILIFILSSCNTQETNQSQNLQNSQSSLDFVKTFEGQINNKYDIAMKLMSNSGQITGNYFYKSVGTSIKLNGQVKEDGNIILNEFDTEGNQTGVFNGKVINSNKIEGQWSKPNGDKQMSFYVIESNSNFEGSQKEINAEKFEGEYSSGSNVLKVSVKNADQIEVNISISNEMCIMSDIKGYLKINETNNFKGKVRFENETKLHNLNIKFQGNKAIVSSNESLQSWGLAPACFIEDTYTR